MIALGYTKAEKMKRIQETARQSGVRRIVIFSPPAFALDSEEIASLTGCEVEAYTYDDIIMYRVFYPLLEKVDASYLLIINECMRTRKRSDLTYNCLHHYLNQTPHRLIFEFFPFVSEPEDFMILLDKETPGKYKGRGLDSAFFKEAPLDIRPHHYTLSQIAVTLPADARAQYEKERDALFDSLGEGDPENVPRRLHIWCGRFKRSYVDAHPELNFVARNARLRRSNIEVYRGAQPNVAYRLLDIPRRQMNMNDFLKISGLHDLQFITTRLPVDDLYYQNLADWIQRLEEFYAQAGVCPEKRG
jgi:hypothetical protein